MSRLDVTQGFLLLSHLPSLWACKTLSSFVAELQQVLDYMMSSQLAETTLGEVLLLGELVKFAAQTLRQNPKARLAPPDSEHAGLRLARQMRPFLYLMLLTALGRKSWLAFLVCAALDLLTGNKELVIYLLRYPLYYWVTKRVLGRVRLFDSLLESYQRFITNTL